MNATIVLMFTLTAFVIGGCGGDDEPGASSAPAPEPQADVPAPASPTESELTAAEQREILRQALALVAPIADWPHNERLNACQRVYDDIDAVVEEIRLGWDNDPTVQDDLTFYPDVVRAHLRQQCKDVNVYEGPDPAVEFDIDRQAIDDIVAQIRSDVAVVEQVCDVMGPSAAAEKFASDWNQRGEAYVDPSVLTAHLEVMCLEW